MINARELRIGNWAKFPSGRNGTNGQISGSDIWDISIGNEINIEPIPLTKEILEKAGFKHVNTLSDGTMSFKGLPYVYFKDGGITISASARKYIYVHELQNIIYALTNSELTINL